MLKEIKCQLCGYNRQVTVYEAADEAKGNNACLYSITEADLSPPKRIIRCSQCGLTFALPYQGPDELLSAYINMQDDKYIEEEAGRRNSARKILSALKGFRMSGNKLLDIGCCTGFLLDEARKMGWEVSGVEVSKWAASYAREKFNLKVYNTTPEKTNFPRSYFDAVIMQDVIEHLLNPKETLVEVRKLLKPDGILYICTPDMESLPSRLLKARWWGINQFHLFYFSKATLKRLLEVLGFKVVKCSSYARTFTMKYWLDRFKNYNKLIYNILMFTAKLFRLENKSFTIKTADQLAVFAKKSRNLEYISEIETPPAPEPERKLKATVILPAYNAAKTLKITYDDIPKDVADEIILIDDASKDETVKIAQGLGIKVFAHKKNKGYGAAQKTAYSKALELGADIVVMVHPDYQYDPRAIPSLIAPIRNGQADAVFGSRMLKGGALIGGMPLWKHNANIFLTALENIIFHTFLTEYHSGFRAYSAKLLKSVRLNDNSDGFIFDTEIIAQALLHYFRIEEVPIRTRYFDEASTLKPWPCILYGFGILKTLLKYILHTHNIIRFKQFE